MDRDPYVVLGVAPDASLREVKRAYRRCVKHAHPDFGGSSFSFLELRRAFESAVKNRPEVTEEITIPLASISPRRNQFVITVSSTQSWFDSPRKTYDENEKSFDDYLRVEQTRLTTAR